MGKVPRACTEIYHKPVACPKCGCSQDLPADLQSCPCHCHPANWPADAAPELLEAAKAFVRLYPGHDECGHCAVCVCRAAITKTEAV